MGSGLEGGVAYIFLQFVYREIRNANKRGKSEEYRKNGKRFSSHPRFSMNSFGSYST